MNYNNASKPSDLDQVPIEMQETSVSYEYRGLINPNGLRISFLIFPLITSKSSPRNKGPFSVMLPKLREIENEIRVFLSLSYVA